MQSDILTLRCLWSDIDDIDAESALRRCDSVGLPRPSATIESGHGVHLYWLLEETVSLRQELLGVEGASQVYATQSDFARSVLKGIASRVGGDPVHDLSRRLRLPGSFNRKNQRNGVKPRLARILELDPGRKYALADFMSFAMGPVSSSDAKSVVASSPELNASNALPPAVRQRLHEALDRCRRATLGNRSEADFHACCEAVRLRVPKESFQTLARDVGKFRERGSAYFDLTWSKAESTRSLSNRSRRDPSYPSRRELPRALWVHGDDRYFGETIEESISAPEREVTDPAFLASRVEASFNGGSRLRYWNGDFYRWDGRTWRRTTQGELKIDVSRAIGGAFQEEYDLGLTSGSRPRRSNCIRPVSKKLKEDVISELQSRCLLRGEGIEWGSDLQSLSKRPWLATTNGILRCDEIHQRIAKGASQSGALASAFGEHTPVFWSSVLLPYAFDASAECPQWLKFLHHVFEGDPQRIGLLQEWWGCLISARTDLHKFMILTGPGGNGKSVICAATAALVGAANVSAVALERFNSRFDLASMNGRLVNIVEEIGEVDKLAEGTLKAIVSGSRISSEQKYKDAVEVTPTARLMFATNLLPRFRDRSNGIWRRLLLLPMNVTISADERVYGMDSPTWWLERNELPGMLNWAIEGLIRLERNGGNFTTSAVSEAAKLEYSQDSNPARLFLSQHYQWTSEESAGVVTDQVYQHYRRWCTDSGYTSPLAANTFGREIKAAFPLAKPGKVVDHKAGRRFNGYHGIARRHDDEED